MSSLRFGASVDQVKTSDVLSADGSGSGIGATDVPNFEIAELNAEVRFDLSEFDLDNNMIMDSAPEDDTGFFIRSVTNISLDNITDSSGNSVPLSLNLEPDFEAGFLVQRLDNGNITFTLVDNDEERTPLRLFAIGSVASILPEDASIFQSDDSVFEDSLLEDNGDNVSVTQDNIDTLDEIDAINRTTGDGDSVVNVLDIIIDFADVIFNGTDAEVETTGGIRGTEQDDILFGTSENDTILGEGGNDTIFGEGGNNVILGGGGNDIIVGGGGNDTILGEGGNDLLIGGDGNELLIAGNGNDRINGGAGDDTIVGGAGDDPVIIGGAGSDTFVLTVDASESDLIRDFNRAEGDQFEVTGSPNDYTLSFSNVFGDAAPDTIIEFQGNQVAVAVDTVTVDLNTDFNFV